MLSLLLLLLLSLLLLLILPLLFLPPLSLFIIIVVVVVFVVEVVVILLLLLLSLAIIKPNNLICIELDGQCGISHLLSKIFYMRFGKFSVLSKFAFFCFLCQNKSSSPSLLLAPPPIPSFHYPSIKAKCAGSARDEFRGEASCREADRGPARLPVDAVPEERGLVRRGRGRGRGLGVGAEVFGVGVEVEKERRSG